MPDMKHIHLFAFLKDAGYHAIHVRLAAVEQVSEVRVLACDRAPARMCLEAQDRLFETPVPFDGGVGMLATNSVVEISEVALPAGGDVKDVCHAELRNRRRTPVPA
jgi:hypothetical protein